MVIIYPSGIQLDPAKKNVQSGGFLFDPVHNFCGLWVVPNRPKIQSFFNMARDWMMLDDVRWSVSTLKPSPSANMTWKFMRRSPPKRTRLLRNQALPRNSKRAVCGECGKIMEDHHVQAKHLTYMHRVPRIKHYRNILKPTSKYFDWVPWTSLGCETRVFWFFA